jgi:exopolyphosphatase/guanosine-5'-triphosphate,3'-diphosphate pyrophosphatase
VKSTRRAVIDVGTNSVKLLVADVSGRQIEPVREESKQTRLGRGFYDTHCLQADAIAATAAAVADFARAARENGAGSIRVIGTSAAREAVNRQELTAAISRASGLEVEVISGEAEADFGFQGVTTDPQLAGAHLLLMDVGGGSTEFNLGRGQERRFRKSFPLGTVRLLEKSRLDDPPAAEQLAACREDIKQFLQHKVRPQLGLALEGSADSSFAGGELVFVGVGGTATILGCMEAKLEAFERARVEATRLDAARLAWHVEHLWSLPLEKRKQITGLPKNRADVILTGVVIYQEVMRAFGLRELRISTRGLRFAAVMEPA